VTAKVICDHISIYYSSTTNLINVKNTSVSIQTGCKTYHSYFQSQQQQRYRQLLCQQVQ